MKTWDVLGDREVYSNPWIRLHLEEVVTPVGDTTEWTVIDIPDAVCVIPRADDGSLWMIRQYRPTMRSIEWEFPAGRVEGDEPLEEAARRELREEAGLVPRQLDYHGFSYPLFGTTRHRIHYLLATELDAVATAHEPHEDIEVHHVPWERAVEMVTSGELRDGVALTALIRTGLWGPAS